jgi:hypothetical protein
MCDAALRGARGRTTTAADRAARNIAAWPPGTVFTKVGTDLASDYVTSELANLRRLDP